MIVFTFCWSPFHAQRLLFLYVSLYSNWTNALRQINQILFLLAGLLLPFIWSIIILLLLPKTNIYLVFSFLFKLRLFFLFEFVNQSIGKKDKNFIYFSIKLIHQSFHLTFTTFITFTYFELWTQIYSALSTRFRAAFSLYVNGCCGVSSNKSCNNSNSGAAGQMAGSKGKHTGSKSNSNNSMIMPGITPIGGNKTNKAQWQSKKQNYLQH